MGGIRGSRKAKAREVSGPTETTQATCDTEEEVIDETLARLDWMDGEEGFVWINTGEMRELCKELHAREIDLIHHMMVRIQSGTNKIVCDDGFTPARIDDITDQMRISKRMAKEYVKNLTDKKIIQACAHIYADGFHETETYFCPALAMREDPTMDGLTCQLFRDYQIRTDNMRTWEDAGFWEDKEANK